MTPKLAANKTTAIHVELADQRRGVFAWDHPGDRPRAPVMSMAATGRPRMPKVLARSCKGWLTSNTDAMAGAGKEEENQAYPEPGFPLSSPNAKEKGQLAD